MTTPPRKIVILGGGIAALTTAHALTSRPDWRERYEITVYQLGHRLGGKGASGRNRRLADRIEEHGIHVFFGFYDNAFRVMKECYDELDRPAGAPLARVTDAFKPSPRISFVEKHRGEWSVWQWEFPPNAHRLGEGGPIPTPWGYVEILLGSMVEWFDQVVKDTPAELAAHLTAILPGHAELLPGLIDRLWRGKRPTVLEAVRDVVAKLRGAVDDVLGEPDQSRRSDRAALGRLVRRTLVVRESARLLGRHLDHLPSVRRALVLFDFAATTILGLVRDELVFPPEDWRKIDGVDLRRWLVKHGAAESTAHCALIDGMYAGIFSTEHEVGAGTMLHYTLRMLFTYRGGLYHKMQAGMGDVVFAPLYQVLARRGVRFEFFHRVDRLELDPGRRRIARIHLGRQIGVASGAYQPLYDVAGLSSWPSEPLYEQLEGGERLEASGESLEDAWTTWPDALPPIILEDGHDFDRVVLGISLGALPGICRELLDDPSNPRFRRMIDALETVGTQAIQLWMEPTAAGLGWTRGDSIVIPYEEPFDTWTDMAHLIERESWRPGEVGAIGYLCSPMPDVEPIPAPGAAGAGYVRRQNARVAENARGWLERYAGWLWPRAATSSGAPGLDGAVLVDRAGRTGLDRLAAQHFSAAANLSDRYNLSLPGSAAARLRPGGSGYANLVLTGDWTQNPINAGCVEAAVMSGLLAARTISSEPRSIPGDWQSGLPDFAPTGASESAARSPRPLYVPLDGNDTPAPPFTARGTRMTVFPVGARRASLQELCDRFLHLGGPTRYRPLAPLVLFYAQDNRRIDSTAPAAGIRELDFGFLVPLLATEPDGRSRIVTFTPFLWVDTELACRAGREIYGYPKAAGALILPAPGSAGSFTVDGFVPDGGDWVMRRLVEARPVAGRVDRAVPESPRAAVAALIDTCRALGDGETAWDLVLGAATDLASGVVPMVFLKQFRDAAEPARACYQALIEADVRRLGPFRAGGLLGRDHELAVVNLPGFPLATRLGLTGQPENGAVVVPVRHPLWLEFDFVMDTGREVWRAE